MFHFNWFTTYSQVVSLLRDNNLFVVETLRKTRREIPKEVLSVKNRAGLRACLGLLFSSVACVMMTKLI